MSEGHLVLSFFMCFFPTPFSDLYFLCLAPTMWEKCRLNGPHDSTLGWYFCGKLHWGSPLASKIEPSWATIVTKSTFRGVSPPKYTEHRREKLPKLNGILAEYGYSLLLQNSKTKFLGHSALYFLRLVRRFSRQSTGLIAQRKPAKR